MDRLSVEITATDGKCKIFPLRFHLTVTQLTAALLTSDYESCLILEDNGKTDDAA
jgi:hypothetical protein